MFQLFTRACCEYQLRVRTTSSLPFLSIAPIIAVVARPLHAHTHVCAQGHTPDTATGAAQTISIVTLATAASRAASRTATTVAS